MRQQSEEGSCDQGRAEGRGNHFDGFHVGKKGRIGNISIDCTASHQSSFRSSDSRIATGVGRTGGSNVPYGLSRVCAILCGPLMSCEEEKESS